MKQWVSLAEGLKLPGLRLAVLRAGVPSPWSELCRALFHVKKLDYAQIDARDPATGLSLLKATTAQESFPVAFWNDEPPRANWLEILQLAERLSDEPRLLPESSADRARMIGLCAELCSEDGFGWNRRLLLTHQLLTDSGFGERERRIGHYLAGKYGYQESRLQHSVRRCEDIVATFARLHAAQSSTENSFFEGNALSAIDLAWAAFATLIRPLPPEQCPMSDLWRTLYTWEPAETPREIVSALLARRDWVYTNYLELPVTVN
jgi:glutathione S-transferase